MITARLIGDLKVGAQKRCTEFGDQLLHRVCIVTKAIPQIAGQAMTGAAPVRELMEHDGIIGLGCRAGLRAKELLRMRYLDDIGDVVVASHIAAVSNIRASGSDECLHVLANLHLVWQLLRRNRPAVYLLGIERPGGPRDQLRSIGCLPCLVFIFCVFLFDGLVENDNCTTLALANLRAYTLPLPVRCPMS